MQVKYIIKIGIIKIQNHIDTYINDEIITALLQHPMILYRNLLVCSRCLSLFDLEIHHLHIGIIFDMEVEIAGCDQEVHMIIFGDEREIRHLRIGEEQRQTDSDNVQMIIMFQVYTIGLL